MGSPGTSGGSESVGDSGVGGGSSSVVMVEQKKDGKTDKDGKGETAGVMGSSAKRIRVAIVRIRECMIRW